MPITEDLIKAFNAGRGNQENPETFLEERYPTLYSQVEKIDELFIEEHRWFNLYQYVYYVKSENRFVAVNAEIGSTENQEDDFDLAYEVKPKQVITTVYTTV